MKIATLLIALLLVACVSCSYNVRKYVNDSKCS